MTNIHSIIKSDPISKTAHTNFFQLVFALKNSGLFFNRHSKNRTKYLQLITKGALPAILQFIFCLQYYEGFESTESIGFGAALYSGTTFFKILSLKTIIPALEFGTNMDVLKKLVTPFENKCLEEGFLQDNHFSNGVNNFFKTQSSKSQLFQSQLLQQKS